MTSKEKLNTEDKIVKAAEIVFLRDGYSGSSMQDIADNAGINKAMLHYYFRSKDKLFEHVFDKKLESMFPQMEELFCQDYSFVEMVKHFVQQYMVLLNENSYLPLFIISTINNPDHQGFMDKLPIGFFRKMVEAYSKDFWAGKVKEVNPMHFMVSVFSMCAFPFMAKPMIIKMTNATDAEFKTLMQSRVTEIHQYIDAILTT